MIFIDTGAFVARYMAADQNHKKALEVWQRLAQENESCATSNFVLNETFTLLARRTGYDFAAERARRILQSESLHILRPNEKQEMEAVVLFEKYGDQKVSFTDCISFVLMKEAKIAQAFSFDRHFALAGFHPYP